MELPLHDEQGGGKKKKQQVLHHLFNQRLYSMIHSYLTTLANQKTMLITSNYVMYHDNEG